MLFNFIISLKKWFEISHLGGGRKSKHIYYLKIAIKPNIMVSINPIIAIGTENLFIFILLSVSYFLV